VTNFHSSPKSWKKKNGALKVHLDTKIGITTTTRRRSASHCDVAIYIKMYLKAKEELWKLKNLFHHAKIDLIFPKKSSKRNQNPSIDIITLL
jgi:hypothetical protein